ncbi:hypothetical protein HETIRDRAFT_325795 [Heterobasidion irregulare TC 32-1]|uniref:Uncharacterized protein n=1 Tax=Heterobasidion irregulare (strain TC 32-1) TaxID=747525 RepID=W4JX53_HETIT|nr:uncharacterized protein HETIRDRAFT_325795 [Heterobasidion irregulare TC 32-1]ETW77660.1 hypothetical protein HETIRDRAFT_325795 [Heterobasidion irregulare TC 32-1]
MACYCKRRNHNFDSRPRRSDQLIDGRSPLGVSQTSICLVRRISLSALQHVSVNFYPRVEASGIAVNARDGIPMIRCLSYVLQGGL